MQWGYRKDEHDYMVGYCSDDEPTLWWWAFNMSICEPEHFVQSVVLALNKGWYKDSYLSATFKDVRFENHLGQEFLVKVKEK